MHLTSYANLHKINRLIKLKSELSEIYLNQVIQTFAVSLIGIFIPIYLLEIGFDLIMVFNYYLIFSVCIIVLSVLPIRLSNKIGLKHTIFLSTIPLITVYMFLQHQPGFSKIKYSGTVSVTMQKIPEPRFSRQKLFCIIL